MPPLPELDQSRRQVPRGPLEAEIRDLADLADQLGIFVGVSIGGWSGRQVGQRRSNLPELAVDRFKLGFHSSSLAFSWRTASICAEASRRLLQRTDLLRFLFALAAGAPRFRAGLSPALVEREQCVNLVGGAAPARAALIRSGSERISLRSSTAPAAGYWPSVGIGSSCGEEASSSAR